MSEMREMSFRMAVPGDGPLILSFIRALAAYERMLDQVVATPELLEEELFQKGRAQVLFVLEDGAGGGLCPVLLQFLHVFGPGGLYLEDLFVQPECRGRGYGKALLKELARIAGSGGAAGWSGGA